MLKNKNIAYTALLSLSGIALLLVTAGCGKDETTGGVFGTASGALVGAAVAPRNPLAGAAIGGLIGNVVGTSVGRSSDRSHDNRQREMEERVHARRLAATQRELSEAESEARALRQANTRWCMKCRAKSTIIGAHSCAHCGGNLISELMCRSCSRTFSPDCRYQCCPYCVGGVALSGR